MVELSPSQMRVVERLFEAGFRAVAVPRYENALCLRKGECAAVLAPVPNGGWKLLAPPSYLVDGNFSVKLRRVGRDVFVWKSRQVEATPQKLRELEEFRQELSTILESPAD